MVGLETEPCGNWPLTLGSTQHGVLSVNHFLHGKQCLNKNSKYVLLHNRCSILALETFQVQFLIDNFVLILIKS